MSLHNASILVTGATGTFGRACIPILLARGVRRVVVYSRDELKQSEMRRILIDERCRFMLGDVRDLSRLELALNGVDWVISAAALKRIESVEADPLEAIKTNVLGTANIIEASLRTGISKVVGLSTDKAAGGFVNLYGATKFCSERLLLAANNISGGRCAFSVVQYGNVFASRGSVVPIWVEQIRTGKPVTVTDPDATRFFMTVEQAVNLVLNTLSTMKGGELIVPKLSAYRLADLAEAMEARMHVTGLASFEKKHETLGDISSDAARRMTIKEIREELDILGITKPRIGVRGIA